MRVTVDDDGYIVLKQVYNGIGLETNDGETFAICMRDSGFEFRYQNKWYSAQNGEIKFLRTI